MQDFVFQTGKKVAKSVGSGDAAEVDAQSENEIHQATASLAQFKNRAPQNIGEYYAHKVEILPEGNDKLPGKIGAVAIHDEVRKQGGADQEQGSCPADVTAGVHLRENLLIELNNDKEHEDGEQAIGVVVGEMVLARLEAVSNQNDVDAAIFHNGSEHIEIEGNIAKEGAPMEGAENDSQLEGCASDPEQIVERTRHPKLSPVRLVFPTRLR